MADTTNYEAIKAKNRRDMRIRRGTDPDFEGHRPYAKERAKTPKATATPAIADLAWAAGFLEGEGSFQRTGRPGKAGSMLVSAPQVNAEPLMRLQTILGGRVGLRSRKGQ